MQLKVYDEKSTNMMVGRSIHWNEILALCKELYPEMPPFHPVTENVMRPTHFDLSRENMIIPIASMKNNRETFQSIVDDLKRKGFLK